MAATQHIFYVRTYVYVRIHRFECYMVKVTKKDCSTAAEICITLKFCQMQNEYIKKMRKSDYIHWSIKLGGKFIHQPLVRKAAVAFTREQIRKKRGEI